MQHHPADSSREGLTFRGSHRSGASPDTSSDLRKETSPANKRRSLCSKIVIDLRKVRKRVLGNIDLSFDAIDDEIAFKATLEAELVYNCFIGTCVLVFCWTMCFLETCDQESVSITSLPAIWKGDVKAVYICVVLAVVAWTFCACLVLFLKMKLGMFRTLQIELFSLAVIMFPLAVCIFCNKWHLPFYFGKHPDAIWAVDRRGEEALIILSITSTMTAWVTFMPIRTCILWILPLSYCSMYITAAVVVGPTFPGYSSQIIVQMMVCANLLLRGARRIEKQKRDDWLVTEKQKQTIQTQELQINEEIKIAQCAEAICESLCDIVLRLKQNLHLFRESRTANSFFDKDLLVHPFTEALCPNDVDRFRSLLDRVDAGALPQCLPVTLNVHGRSVNSSLIVLSTGVSEPKYLISIRCDHHGDCEDDQHDVDTNFRKWLPDWEASTTHPCEEDSISLADDSVSVFRKQITEDADAPETWKEDDDAATAITFKTIPKGRQEMCSFKPAMGLGMGNYTLIKTAGRGSQASVFQVTDEMGQCFALKRIFLLGKIYQKDFPEHLASWDREVRSLKSLSWAAEVIVQIHEAWVQSDFKVACIVMEWMPGTLAQAVDKRFASDGSVSVREMSSWFVQIAFAIAAIHSIGWIHRDIKTNNILLSEDEQCCKVADLGIGRPTHNGLEDDAATEVESVKTSYTENRGTPAYMSPEALAKGGHYSKPVDVFGLGCILLEMIVGRNSFLKAAENGIGVQIASALFEATDVAQRMNSEGNGLGRSLMALDLKMLTEIAEDRPTAAMILANESLKESVAQILKRAPSLIRAAS